MIEATHLTKRYGKTVAVDEVSFTVRPGQVTGFLGPNGAGKSTTMRMILGLDTPSSGSVLVNGRPYRELTDPLRSVGALLDAKAIVGGRSAASHLGWLADSNGIARRRVREVLEVVGLSDVAGQRVGTFSLGMNQRLGIAAALLLIAGGIGAGGYFALRYHQESQATARNDAAALRVAIDCVAATQAPDTNAMAASEQKIIDCGTDVYRTQALLYSSLLVQAYQAANAHVQVSDERAAVERTNSDGTVDVLVALRVKVSNDQAQNQETGYRLRVKMELVDGQYKIAKLDQVTK